MKVHELLGDDRGRLRVRSIEREDANDANR